MADDIIYGNYTQAQLDAQYNNRAMVPEFQQHFDAWDEWSTAASANHAHQFDIAFGDTPEEKLDLFPCDRDNAPVVLFIHGGYWIALDKAPFRFVASGLVPNGVTVAVNNYCLAPNCDMDEIVRQNRAAIAWLYRNARSFGADPEQIYVAGHSAGGHLTAVALTTDWPSFGTDLPANLVKGGCAISGLYDLEPIRLSYINETIGLDQATAARNSLKDQGAPARAPLVVTWGGDESDEFARQSKILSALWTDHGYPLEVMPLNGLNHFTMVNQLRMPDSEVSLAILRLMTQ